MAKLVSLTVLGKSEAVCSGLGACVVADSLNDVTDSLNAGNGDVVLNVGLLRVSNEEESVVVNVAAVVVFSSSLLSDFARKVGLMKDLVVYLCLFLR